MTNGEEIYDTTLTLSKFKNDITGVKVPVADFKSFNIAASKKQTIIMAKKLDIPTPDTFFPNSFTKAVYEEFKYPLVVKGIRGGSVLYPNNLSELRQSIKEIFLQQGEYPLIQEYIPGIGYGFFGLFNKGEMRAFFMHKRIREYPITGGPSTCAESVYEPKLLQYGEKLLKALNWHGVAMVEFRKDIKDGEYKLMEINPKFWGSLDLAISSGVDFPYLLYKMAVEGEIERVFSYQVDIRFAWPFPDDFLRTITRPTDFNLFLLDLFNPIVSKNISCSDPIPNLIQLAETIVIIARKLAYGR
jgi:predicted ATP-grasp superfamily ATP-dependent carboligase